MELTTRQSAPIWLRIARNAVGMCVVALANPLIYFDASPIEQWAILPIGAVAIAAALFGVLALISTARAKATWPTAPIRAAWVILALMLLTTWQGNNAQPRPKAPDALAKPACKAGATEVDAFLDDCQR